MSKYPFIQRNLQLVRTFLDFFGILPEDSKRSWAFIIFMQRLLSTWRGNAWRSQCTWKTYSRLTEGSRNKGPAVLYFKANIRLLVFKQRRRTLSWIPAGPVGPRRSAPEGGMWADARGNESLFSKCSLQSMRTHFRMLIVFGTVQEPTSRVEVAFATADQGVLVS